jgi:quinoprotein relay system zinc metallohydrolase 2
MIAGRLLATCLSALALCAVTRAAGPTPAEQLAEGVYHLPGREAVWGEAGHGQVANTGFVVGQSCVAVIDTGGSPSAGRALLAAVRRVSALPICYVVNTHGHPDHVLGNIAFVDANGSGPPPQFVGHRYLGVALDLRGPHYRQAMEKMFPPEDLAQHIPQPTLKVSDRLELDLGGRTLELHAWPVAHTDSDLTIFDMASGTLWLGDLASSSRVPVLDGHLRGWLQVLRSLQSMGTRPALVVPGHGPVTHGWPDALTPTQEYLQQLHDGVLAARREGLTLAQTLERLRSIQPQGDANWAWHDNFQRRNVVLAFGELEWLR